MEDMHEDFVKAARLITAVNVTAVAQALQEQYRAGFQSGYERGERSGISRYRTEPSNPFN